MSQTKYDQRTEQHIASLQTDFAELVRQWLAQCRQQGLNPYIHFGSRSLEKQRELRDAEGYFKGTWFKFFDPLAEAIHHHGQPTVPYKLMSVEDLN